MEENKTTLQKIVKQKAEQIKIAVLQAIEEGADVEQTYAGVNVDGVFFVGNAAVDQKEITLCIRIKSDKFEELLRPTPLLDKEAEELRKRLKEIEEIKERRAKK